MSNKNFLTAFGAFSVTFALLIWFVIASWPMGYLDREYAIWQAKKELSLTEDVGQDVVIIGDSRAVAGINPQWSQYKVKNLALGGGTPIEGFLTLERYLQHNPAPKKLIISFTPDHLLRGLFFSRTLAFRYIEAQEAYQVIDKAQALQDTQMSDYANERVISKNRDEVVYYDYYSPTKYIDSLINGLMALRIRTNEKTYANTLKTQGHAFFGSAKSNNQVNGITKISAGTTVPPASNYYLIQIIELAKKHNIQTYYAVMPFNEASCEATKSSAVLTDYLAYVQGLSQRFELNKSLLPLECLSPSHFGDASHLNEQGARWMTAKMDELL